jgi:hypothetical protein
VTYSSVDTLPQPGIRPLTEEEIEEVNGGILQILAAAIIGGAISGAGSAMNGKSFWGGFTSGATSGALVGSGIGIFGVSAVAGTTLIGTGAALGVASQAD